MTTTDTQNALELDELSVWDDADTLDRLAQQLTAADARSLAIYGLDSDQQTLVGLGPTERARRSHEAAEKPDSQRMPQSEAPGPFIAAEDEELPSLLHSPKPRRWAIALPALLLVAGGALVLVRGRASESPPAPKVARPTGASQPPVAPVEPAPVETQPAASLEPSVEERAELRPSEVPLHGTQAPAPATRAPSRAAVLPVKLPELSAPVLIDRSSATDANVGTINVTSNPPASVVLDGRPLGKAPLVVRVPAGSHPLVFIHPLYGRRSLSVRVSPGATTAASTEF
jgi:hypothetical protein